MRVFPTWRTCKRWAIGAALVVALLLIANAIMAWQANHRLENQRAALRAAGQPASIADLAPQPIPAESNAAVHLERIKPQLDAFHHDYSAFYKTVLGKDWSTRQEKGELPTPEQATEMNAILARYPEILSAMDRAAAADRYASLLDFTLTHAAFIQAIIDRQTYVRSLARLVDWKATLLIQEKQADQAVRLGVQLLKLGRLYENEPTLVNYLVTVAVRGMAIDGLNRAVRSGPISNETRSLLQAELNLQDRPGLPQALRSEWAMVLDFEPNANIPIPAGWPITRWMLREASALDGSIEAAARPYYEVRSKFGKQAEEEAKASGNSVALLMPAIRAAFQAEARRLALARTLRILVALDAHQRRRGQEAGGLDELNLPAEATADPFTGEPLKLKLTDAGWVVYSVMENGVDDGGDFEDVKDYGVAPAGWKLSD